MAAKRQHRPEGLLSYSSSPICQGGVLSLFFCFMDMCFLSPRNLHLTPHPISGPLTLSKPMSYWASGQKHQRNSAYKNNKEGCLFWFQQQLRLWVKLQTANVYIWGCFSLFLSSPSPFSFSIHPWSDASSSISRDTAGSLWLCPFPSSWPLHGV